MTAETYARFYSISPILIPVMEKLNAKDWWFLRNKVSEDGMVIVKTGYYSGSGAFTKRESIAQKLIAAAEKCGFKAFRFYNGSAKGARAERVKIITVPTALKRDFNNK